MEYTWYNYTKGKGVTFMENKILIVEDEPLLLDILCDYFRAKGQTPIPAKNGREALSYLEAHTADAVLLDILMPEVDGFTVCRAVRKHSAVPIILLTALSDEDDKLRGYELGADDYVVKPCSMAVLYAKTMALISRYHGTVGRRDSITVSGITLNLNDRLLVLDGKSQELPNREFLLLRCLMIHKNQILSREQLLRMIWGYDYEGDPRTVDTHIKKLRARGIPIDTVIRAGYRLKEVDAH